MNFRHGSSETLPLESAVSQLQELMDSRPAGEIVLVFHDARADLDTIKSLKLKIPDRCAIRDTRTLFASRQHSAKGVFSSLGKMLDILEIQALQLHNAGNDADGTMRAFIILCTEPELDATEKE